MRKLIEIILILSCLAFLQGCGSDLVRKEDRQGYFNIRDGASLVIYPINVVEGLSQRRSFAAAESLAVRLENNVFGIVSVADLPLPISVDFLSAPGKIQYNTALSLARRIRRYSPPADFALYIEIFLQSCSRIPSRAHYYICNYEGNLVDCGILDADDEVWKLVQPDNEFECTGVISGTIFR